MLNLLASVCHSYCDSRVVQHGLKLSMEYKIPKMAYKGKVGGEVVPQWLRKPKGAPGIQAVNHDGEAAAGNTNAAALGALESGGAVVPATHSATAPALPAPTHGTFRRQGAGMDLRTGEESKGALDKIAEGVQGGSSDDLEASTSSSAKHVAETIRQQSRGDGTARGPLIQELQPGAVLSGSDTKHLSTENTTAAATGMAPRRSRKLAAGPKPVSAPLVFAKAAVSLFFDPPTGAVQGAPPRCEAWSYDKWDLIPLNYSRDSNAAAPPFAVRVTWQCDAGHPQLMVWATALRRRVEAAAAAGGREHTTLASLPSLHISVGEETACLSLPGHRETTTALPVVLDVGQLGKHTPVALQSTTPASVSASSGCLGISVDIAAAVVTLTLPVARIDPGSISGADPGSRPWLVAAALDGGDDASGGSGAVDATSVAAARYKGGSAHTQAAAAAAAAARAAAAANAKAEGPVGEDEELPEDKFHKSDAMSQHYLAQRAQAAAEAEAKRAANARPDPYEGLDFKDRVSKASAELVAKLAADESADVGGAAVTTAAVPDQGEEELQCLERVFEMI